MVLVPLVVLDCREMIICKIFASCFSSVIVYFYLFFSSDLAWNDDLGLKNGPQMHGTAE